VIQIETLMMFFVASVLLALAPGPDNIFVITLAALRGSFAGLSVGIKARHDEAINVGA
jgi:threonine/homoserine/homoserine lactone efflux protein